MQKGKTTRRQIYLALLCFTSAGAVSSKNLSASFPPAGFYRVDSESNIEHLQNGTGVIAKDSGATGIVQERVYSKESPGTDRFVEGVGSLNRCVKPAPTAAEFAIAAAPMLANCHAHSQVVTRDGLVLKTQCKPGAVTTTIHKVNGTTWDYTYVIATSQPAGGADISSMRPMMESMAKNSPDPAVRENAARQLAQLPQTQMRMTQQQLAAIDMYAKIERQAQSPEDAARIRSAREAFAGKTPTMEIRRKERWTRVADSCGNFPAAH